MDGPWGSKPKGSQDLLLDIFLQMPDVLAKTDTAFSFPRPIDVLHNGSEILQLCLELDKKLDNWFSDYQAVTGSLYWPEFSTINSSTDSLELGKAFPVSLHFPSYIVAETMIIYWTVQLLLHAHVCSLHSRLSSVEGVILGHHDGSAGLSGRDGIDCSQATKEDLWEPWVDKLSNFPNHRANWPRTSARYICQSVEYFFDERYHSIGPGTILPPLIVVRTCLANLPEDWARETVWIDEMISRINGMGANLAEYV